MRPTELRYLFVVCTWSAVTVAAGAGCGGASNNPGNDAGPMGDIALAQPDFSVKPDMTNLGMDPVGSPCTKVDNCSGNKPVCKKQLDKFNPPLPAPNGYCSNDPCKADKDCGKGGICVAAAGYCFAPCTMKGECDKLNSGTICATIVQADMTQACIPNPFKDPCNPTDPMSCGGTGACSRYGGLIDDVGQCMTTCMLGGMCPDDAQGNAQGCYFLNFRVDVMGKDTGDAYAGLTCIVEDPMGTAGPDGACKFLNSCQAGYECNFFKAAGVGMVCKKLCHNGGNECVLGTCQNAFLLKNFAMGDVGLCL